MSWLTSAWLFYPGFLLALVAPIILFWYFGRIRETGKTYSQSAAEGMKQTFDDLQGRLSQLLRSGFDQGFVVFKFSDGECSIQFRKYIHAKGDYGLELGFPRADWSRVYFPLVAECCDKNDIPYTIGPHNTGDDMEFLHADVGKDTEAAFRLVCDIVDDAFRISRDAPYTLEWDAIDATGGLIDSPNQTPGKRQRQYGQEYFKEAGFYISDILVAIIWMFAVIVGGTGLIYALFWWLIWAATGVNPDWGAFEFRIGGFDLRIRNFQLYSAIALASAFLLSRTPSMRRFSAVTRADQTEEDKRKRSRRKKIIWRVLIPLILSSTVASWIRW